MADLLVFCAVVLCSKLWSCGISEALKRYLFVSNLSDLLRVLQQHPVVLVSVVATRGSVPRDAGAWMAVLPTGLLGTIGGGRLELDAEAAARALLEAHHAGQIVAPVEKRMGLGPSLGQCCGGEVQLRYELVRAADAPALRDRLAPALWPVGLFGGGHVVLPLLDAETVTTGWISKDAFLAGYGAAQAVPGPLFTFAAYLGAVMGPQPNGWDGAALCLVAVFLPSFLLVIGTLPFWDQLRRLPAAQGVLRGINAIPLIGGLNRILGFAFGFVSGLLNCWIWSILLWVAANLTGGKLEFLTTATLNRSVIYGLLANLNPFLTRY